MAKDASLSTHPLIAQFFTDLVEEWTLSMLLVNQQRLHGIAGSRVVALGVHNWKEETLQIITRYCA